MAEKMRRKKTVFYKRKMRRTEHIRMEKKKGEGNS